MNKKGQKEKKTKEKREQSFNKIQKTKIYNFITPDEDYKSTLSVPKIPVSESSIRMHTFYGIKFGIV